MGQTLEHGIFLPDEGERNCYAGLAANWRALDAHLGNTDIHVTYADKQAWNGHVADTDKHVTASDKTTWNGHVADTVKHVTASDKQTWNGKQDALSQTQLDAVNSGIDSSKVQQIATNTSDISSLQSGKANDSDVVHKSGNETIAGVKTFSNNIQCFGDSDAKSIIFKTPLATYESTNTVGDSTRIQFLDKNNNPISYIRQRKLTNGNTDISLNISNTDSNNQPIEATLNFVLDSSNDPRLSPGIDNTISLGRPTFRYKSVYATNYYYGSNNVEFSTKFVTTDTTQTITGQKIFSTTTYIYNIDSTANTPGLFLRNSKVTKGGSDTGNQSIFFTDKDNKTLSKVLINNSSNGTTSLNLIVGTLDDNNADVSAEVYLYVAKNGTKVLQASADNDIYLGRTTNRWKDTNTCLINGLEPSALGMPDFANGIDISSYITHLDKVVNNYTPPSNGWLSIRVKKTSLAHTSLMMYQTGGLLNSCETTEFSISGANLPVIANQNVEIYIIADNLASAKFYPCLGNV